MIPPVPPEVFANNPQFKELYTQLATEILNPHDGSTREADKSESETSLEQVLLYFRYPPHEITGVPYPPSMPSIF